MNILYIVDTDPRQTSYGGPQRIHFVWEGLKKFGDVYTVVPVVRNRYEARDDANRIYKVRFERRYSPSWFVKRLTLKWNNHIPIPFLYTKERLRGLGLPKFDVCVVRPASNAACFNLWGECPVCVDMDDIPLAEVDVQEQKYGKTIATRIRRYLLDRMQKKVYARAKHIWIADEEEFSRFPGLPVSFLPNIPLPPLPDFADEIGLNNKLFFVGSLNSSPNFLALDWFLSEMWGGLKKKFPELVFDIGGGGLPEHYKKTWSVYPDVHLLGRVDDLRPYYKNALAVVAPMRIGSGSCLKVLEALRMGRPLISTQQGLRGIRPEFRNSANGILPFEDLDTLVAAIDTLRSSDRIALQRAAVAFVQQRNTQAFIDATLKKDIEAVLHTES